MNVVYRMLDKAGLLIVEPRREDGHGSAIETPTFVDTGLTQPTTPSDTQPVKDDYAASELLGDQSGADDVLSFTLTQAANLIIVDADNDDPADYIAYRCRATVDGSEPTVETGFVCRSGQSTILPVPTSGTQVKVYAPAGVTVAVQAIRR